MLEAPLRSRLAVLLHADVLGSTELVQRDEVLAHQRMRKAFESLEHSIDEYGGRTHELRGDALIAEFAGGSDAIGAALAFQHANATANAAIEDDIRPEVRIGIALGEVLFADSTVTGAGIVLAQRLEQLAGPGGVVVQRAVYETVPRRFPFSYESLGERSLKGFDELVTAYAVGLRSGDSLPDPQKGADVEGAVVPVAQRVSVAVLPFSNLGSDPDQQYFSDGITEDVITDLSKVSRLFVLARNSSFAYRDRSDAVSALGRELGVRYVLEGKVRRAGARIRVSVQLLDTKTRGHVWAERYDRDLTDVFAVQDDIVRQIVSALAARLTPDERARLGVANPANLEAYDSFLRGREAMFELTREANAKAQTLLERAISLSPQFAPAYAMLGAALCTAYTNAWATKPEEDLVRATELARQAVALDDSLSQAHWVLGLALMWSRQHDLAARELRRAIELDPSFTHAYAALGTLCSYDHRPDEAYDSLEMAMRLHPHYPDLFLHFLGLAYFVAARYEAAADTLSRRISRRPDTDISRVLLASSYGHLGQKDEAQAQWVEALRVNPDYSLEQKRGALPFRDPADFERIVEGLRLAGIDA